MIIVILLVITVVAGALFFLHSRSEASKNLSETNQPSAQDEVKKLAQEVGKLIDLPEGEVPTIATVTDINKLKDQTFFQKAKNGDKVLIYSKARKAILYDPVAKKVIDVAPINLGSSSAQLASPSPSASPKPTPKPSPTPSP